MWKKLPRLFVLAAAALSFAIVACSSPDEPSGDAAGGTPDAQATITAIAKGSSFSPPTPTPTPRDVIDAVQEFSLGINAVNREWDDLRADYDKWRSGLAQCEPVALQGAIGEFTGRFAAISQSARNLGRSSATRELADRAILAADIEERALLSLGENWSQSDSHGSAGGAGGGGAGMSSGLTSPSAEAEDDEKAGLSPASGQASRSSQAALFGQVYDARVEAALELQTVSDAIADWEQRTSKSGKMRLEDFDRALRKLNHEWDHFHEAYDASRAKSVDLSDRLVLAELNSLVIDFSLVVQAARDLPAYGETAAVASLMAQIAEAEDLALRVLRASVQTKVAEAAQAAQELEEAEAEKDPPSPLSLTSAKTGTTGGGSATAGPSPFEVFETELVIANAGRREALQFMAGLTGSLSEAQVEAFAEFKKQFQSLMMEWDDFHRDYDEWRASEGGCDREEAIGGLAGLGVRYNELSSMTVSLPSVSVLRPIGELTVEATSREASAMKNLRDNWRPFDSGVYLPFRQARTDADRMRRQVALGLQGLLEQYGIDPG